MSLAKSLIVWLFLNRSSYSSTIFCLLSSVSMCLIMFVFVFPCSRISSLSSQSSPNKGWVFLFSVINMGSVILLFSVFTSTMVSPLNFIGFSFTSTKLFVVLCVSAVLIIGGIIVTGEPVSIMNSIGCPLTNRIAL